MTQKNDTTPPISIPANGPGPLLRQARADLRLAPEDVAQMLKLAPRQILALEENDFASLPGPTYVRGYLRGYAQLLGLKPEPIVEAFNRLAVSAPKVDLTKLAPEPQLGSDHHLVRFVSIGMVVIILGLALAWWFGRTERPAPPPVTLSPASPTAETPVLPVEPDKVAGDEPATVPGPVPGPVADQKPVTATGGAPAAPGALPVPKPMVVTPAPAPVPVVPAREPAAPVAPAPVAVSPPAGPRVKLTLVTTQDSWAEVRDARQNKLLYETVAAGRTVVLEGAGPLSVFLGNAEGVGVEFNGKSYDTTPHRRGPIARFTLGEAGAGSSTSTVNVPQ